MNDNSQYDTGIVLGTGIKEDGSLPESAKKNILKIIELYQSGIIPRVIFSGKWAWNLKYTPPCTEADSMKKYAVDLGFPEDKILQDQESVTTVSNLCNVKKNILLPQNFNQVLLVVPHEVLIPRYQYNVQMVFGSEIKFDIISSGMEYSAETLQRLTDTEPGKLEDAKKFYGSLNPGDHETIYRKAMADLQDNYINK